MTIAEEASAAYISLYEEVMKRDRNRVSLNLLCPEPGKPKSVLIAWVLGAWDGAGDRGDVEVEEFMERLRLRMEPIDREWWDEWQAATKS